MARTWQQTFLHHLRSGWQHRGLTPVLLLPVALLYRTLVGLRRALYRWGIFSSSKVAVPVIVVGNAITGGTGKTPTTIALVQHLQARGWVVGVVSRGYGRRGHAVQAVHAAATPEDVGDEPLLIRRSTGAPVWVGASRFAAAQSLLQHTPGVNVLVCDDGLQHYGLYRDIEICVFDNRGCGNGWPLPAGPLREPWPRRLLPGAGQSEASTLVLHTGTRPAFGGFRATRVLAGFAVSCDAKRTSLEALATSAGKPIFAVAGIAQPEAFFGMLRALHVPLAGTLALADHAHFDTFDLQLAHSHTVLCTEKDAAKLWRRVPQAWAVPLVQTMEPAFFAALDGLLQRSAEASLSSRHGQKTT